MVGPPGLPTAAKRVALFNLNQQGSKRWLCGKRFRTGDENGCGTAASIATAIDSSTAN
jgi:hypothetical protein